MERVMSELTSCLAADKMLEVHLVLYGIKPEVFYILDPRVKVYQPDFPFDNNRRIWSTWKRCRYIRSTVLALKPDAVLSFGEFWNSMVISSLLFSGVRIFVSDRCQPDKPMPVHHAFLRWLLYRFAYGIVAQTETARDIFKQKLRHPNIRVIGNPIRQIAGDAELTKENSVLMVGRLISTKHHDQLIRIFSKVQFDDWKLVIIGGDALKQKNMEKLLKMVSDLGLEGKVMLAGNRSDVEAFYHRSKIFAFTSSSEGFPNVIGEAMSAGLPVIAYNCVAGPADLINDGHDGFLVPVFDEAEFAEKLELLMRDKGLQTRMGEAAAQSIRKFSVESVSQAYKKFLLES